jgi:uncharacterized protein (DUF1697 family)
MPSHVALLRGINVGGRKRVAMADLREVVESLGHADVATYIQSGHVVFTSNHTDTAAIAGALGRALEETLGVRSSVVVLSRAELAKVIADNPFPDEANPKQLHAIFRGAEVGAQEAAAVAAAERRARDEGGRDQAKVVGRTVYLRTPDGLGRSELAAQLARSNPTPKTGAAPPATGRPSPSCWRCWTPDSGILRTLRSPLSCPTCGLHSAEALSSATIWSSGWPPATVRLVTLSGAWSAFYEASAASVPVV